MGRPGGSTQSRATGGLRATARSELPNGNLRNRPARASRASRALSTAFTALVRRLTGSRGAAAVAAICFPFCPYAMSNTAEIQLLATAGFPVTMLAFHRLADRPTAGRGVVLGAALAVTALFCGYYGILAGLMVGWASIVLAGTRHRWGSLRYWGVVGLAAATSILLVLPFFRPYLSLAKMAAAGSYRPLAEAVLSSGNWQAYLASGARAHQWMLTFVRGPSAILFPGFLTIGLAAAGLVAALRRPAALQKEREGEAGGVPTRPSETVALYGSLAILAFWLSLGPHAGLYL